MRKTALLFVIAVCGYAAKAQFTLRPQLGFEAPVTKISYNNLPYFKPGCQLSALAGIRAEYSFKGGLGPFFGLFTHRPLVTYSFNDPETGMSVYNATKGNIGMQLQGGLQFSSKPIALNKKAASTQAKSADISPTNNICRQYSHGCCHKNSGSAQTAKSQNNWTLRLQPSAGVAYIPSGKQDIEIQNSGAQPTYVYNAGNVKTEFIAGMGFEFARNKSRYLSVSFNYFKGLGNNATSFSTESSTKTVSTVLSSKVYGWSATIGIPISFSKNKLAFKSNSNASEKTYHHCGQYYKTRCGQYIRI